jgi:hypothetical protein
MVRIGVSLAALALCVACQSPSQTAVSREEVMMASGFKRVPATTPQQQATLQQLTPQKFSRQSHKGQVVFVYADPAGCACLYVGNLNAYTAYKSTMRDKKLADEQALAANETKMNDLDWGPWGPDPVGTW